MRKVAERSNMEDERFFVRVKILLKASVAVVEWLASSLSELCVGGFGY